MTANNSMPQNTNWLDEIISFLAEDYVEMDDVEVNAMWKMDVKVAKKQIIDHIEALIREIIGTSLDDNSEPDELNKIYDAYNSRVTLRQEQRARAAELIEGLRG